MRTITPYKVATVFIIASIILDVIIYTLSARATKFEQEKNYITEQCNIELEKSTKTIQQLQEKCNTNDIFLKYIEEISRIKNNK